ncbi:MAG: hypothetical protein JWQ40_3805 [Segetibacter sp.]|nr:hypothetical protein [Segetibacter sp.]
MKLIVSLLFILGISITASKAQGRFQPNEETGVAVGLTGGYSSKMSAVGNFSVGAMVKNLNHFSINLQLFGNASAVNVPVIGEARVGHVFGTVEIYGGYGYHYAGTDHAHEEGVVEFKSGFKPAFGIVKHFYQSLWTVGAGMSGNTFSLQVGIFAVR